MRQWLVNTNFLCDKHLLGEHVEHHMFVGCINKNMNLDGYFEKNLFDTSKIKSRHAELVKEMRKRHMRHTSDLPKFKYKKIGKVNINANVQELKNRCKECRKRIGENE